MNYLSNASLHIMEQTYHTYPKAWYEYSWLISKKLLITVALPLLWLQIALGLFPNTALSVLGLIAYCVGLTTDVLSTARLSKYSDEFEKLGMENPTKETAAFYPENPTLKNILTHWHFWFMVFHAPIAFFVPAAAFVIFWARVCATLNNLMLEKRILLTLVKIKQIYKHTHRNNHSK